MDASEYCPESRAWHGFSNGKFSVNTLQFVPFDAPEFASLPKPYTEHAVAWDVNTAFALSNMPAMDLLLDTQLLNWYTNVEHAAPAKRWILALLGRLLHPVGARDTWGIVPMLEGDGHGKTTLLNVVRDFFDVGSSLSLGPQSHRLMSATIASPAIHVWTATAFDDLPQELTPIITAEVSSLGFTVTAPGIVEATGKVPAKWAENKALARRTVVIPFNKRVDAAKQDPSLLTKLRKELPTIMYVAAREYQTAAAVFGRRDLFSEVMTPSLTSERILPTFFRRC
jgi:hypothetical protein